MSERSEPQAVNPILSTDAGALQLARELIAGAKSGALATLQADGHPFSSLTSLAMDEDGTPLILVSQLASHTKNLQRDPRASLLIASTGKGDPLAHPRITLIVRAELIPHNGIDYERCRNHFLAQQPKAALYIDFPDFAILALKIQRASLNGGFGKAYELTREDIMGEVRSGE